MNKLDLDRLFWCWCRWNSDLSPNDRHWQDTAFQQLAQLPGPIHPLIRAAALIRMGKSGFPAPENKS